MDEGIYPVVHDRGIVELDRSCGRLVESGMEGFFYGRKVPRRPAAGSRERTAGRPWPAGGSAPAGSWSASPAPSIFSKLTLSDKVAAYLEGVAGAYPQVQVRPTPDLIWMLNCIKPIRGLEETALLATAYPIDSRYDIISWAWWGPGLIWIGPRHTNYGDGSICSFEPSDGTWQQGQPLSKLLDLHVVWIVRHLFMRRFGRWPGHQTLHTPWERLNEHRPGELCGKCNSGKRYEDCCRPFDEAIDPVDRLMSFMKHVRGTYERRPPRSVVEFVYGSRTIPPSLSELPCYRNQKFPSRSVSSSSPEDQIC